MGNKSGTLYIVSTPIGNLNDITNRAIEILNKVDICAAEDTRKSIKLFNAHNINTKLTSYHKFSENTQTKRLIEELLSGKDVAIISDAGTPLISDPGRYLVNGAIEQGITIVPIPGVTSVVFESGKRIRKLLDDISKELREEIQIFVAREMTKIHETFYRGTALEVKEQLDSSEFGTKGEFVLIISAFEKILEEDFSDEDKRIMELLWDSLSQKEALSLGSKILNKKRNFLYQKKIDNN